MIARRHHGTAFAKSKQRLFARRGRRRVVIANPGPAHPL
ncbi:hypothetical protein BIWAKO_06108 [Bosea sp. BIWAKO-01]|nr:hypothetical protein BIWAKO_06108 [Bosea sp. BIWAKO-01]